MRRFFLVLLPVLFLNGFKSWSQQMLTLEQAIATALQNNYDIQLAKNDSLIAALDYSYRNAAFLPAINASASTSRNVNNQRLKFVKRSGGGGDSAVNRDAVRTVNMNYSVNLNWVLFDGLRMFATRQKAQEYVVLGSLTIKDQLINTISSVVTVYYNIVRQKQQLRAIEEQIVLNEERVRLSQYKLDIGTGIKPDVLQSKVDLNAQKALKLQQQALTEQLKEQLRQIMNTSNPVYDVSDSIPINTGLTLHDIQNGIEKTNPALLIAQKNVDISRLTIKERKADRFPTISFNSAYNFNQNDNNVAVNIFQPFFNQNRGYNYGVSTTIPLFNRFNVKRLIRQAELDNRYQQLVYANQRSVLDLNVIIAFKDYEMQKQALALEEENILLARENVDIIFQTYKLGAATLVQLREAQNSLEDANNRLIAARYATKLAETELLRLKGDFVK
jgi:outer membrane protein TolC